ncbi:hypothetical protein [Kitasatospora sp. NPDC057223]|uniref:hypothetical protein n=1 Tax=Kitasatospora sp. NPDC057223 TaxID=3346055 RepID=UPI00363174E2
MISNSLSSGAQRMAAAGRRLLGFGYWGPLLLVVVVGRITMTPRDSGHEWLVLAAAGAAVLVPILTLLFGAARTPATAVPAAGPTEAAESPAARWSLRRPQRPGNSVLVGCLLANGALVLGSSVPGGDYSLLGVGMAALVLLPFAWLVWQVVQIWQPAPAAPRPAGRAGAKQRLGRWRWAAAPLLVGATVLLIGSGIPQEARFAVARPALTSFAERALATGSIGTAPAWINGYPLQDLELADGGVKFAVRGAGLLAPHGFAWFPPAGPTKHRIEYTEVGGGWYSWSGADHI